MGNSESPHVFAVPLALFMVSTSSCTRFPSLLNRYSRLEVNYIERIEYIITRQLIGMAGLISNPLNCIQIRK